MKKMWLCLWFLGAILFANNAGALALTINPTSQTVDSGNQAGFDLNISGLGNGVAPSLGVFDIDVAFDPAVLSFFSAVYGDPVLGDQLDVLGLGSFTATTLGVGTVNLFELSFDTVADLESLQAPAFTLARLTFDAIGPGTSSIAVSINALGNANGDPLTDLSVGGGSITVEGSVNPAPEPATVALLGLGLVGLRLSRRKRR